MILPTSSTVVLLSNVDIFQLDTKVLEEVNLKIDQGEFVYLIGKTGSGKSSLLKTLYAALPFTSGNGSVAGFDLSKQNRRTIPNLRRQLGIVFQDFNLLADRNVFANLKFVLDATGWKDDLQKDERIKYVLTQVGLAEMASKMPNELSGGEQQRVVIARALLNEPKLIIADEPTGNLDPETADEILLLLRHLAKEHNAAVLLATHDYRIMESFPARIIRCHNRRIIDDEAVIL